MGTLYRLLFVSHQLARLFEVWLGGQFYDLYGCYHIVWWVGVGMCGFSAIAHLPIEERPRDLSLAWAEVTAPSELLTRSASDACSMNAADEFCSRLSRVVLV